MPIPKPSEKESQDDFMSRCMTAMSDERDLSDEDERAKATAICMRTYREAKSMNYMKLMNMLAPEVRNTIQSVTKDLVVAKYEEYEEEDQPVMLVMLHDEISDEGITSNDLVARIKGMDPRTSLVCDINSIGGSVYDACSIHNAMVEHPGRVRADITGVCGSAMTMVASGADTIRIGELGSYFVHEASAVWMGTKQSMRGMADMLAEADMMISAALAKRSGMKPEEVMAMMEKDGFGSSINGKQAVELGFADELIPSKEKRREERSLTRREEEMVVGLQRFQVANIRRKLAAKMQ